MGHDVHRVGEDEDDAVRRVQRDLGHDGFIDGDVPGDKIESALALVLARAGGDDDHVAVSGVGEVAGGEHRHLRGELGSVEEILRLGAQDLLLGSDVVQDDLTTRRLVDHRVGAREADLTGADDGHLGRGGGVGRTSGTE